MNLYLWTFTIQFDKPLEIENNITIIIYYMIPTSYDANANLTYMLFSQYTYKYSAIFLFRHWKVVLLHVLHDRNILCNYRFLASRV